jgi:GPH family glycoside/pentoside/hexuronide:cation symporter
MIFSAIPIVIAYFLLFSIPPGLSGAALFAYAFTALFAVRIGLSGFIVPYVALGAELSDDYAERSTIVAARVLFSVLAGTAAAFLAYGVFMKGPGGQMHREVYPPFAMSSCAIVILGATISAFGTLGARHRLHAAAPGQGAALGRFLAEIAEVFRNRSFRTLFITCLIFFAASGAAGALTLHANTYFWKLPTPAILVISLTGTFGVFIGVFVVAFVARLLEKKSMAVVGLSVIGLCQFFPVVLQLSGLIPPGAAVIALMTSAFLAGIGISAALIGFQSMMADAADEHEHLFGARREGLYFAGISLSVKASSGVGALLAGIGLDLIGFPHGLGGAGGAHIVIPDETVRNLGLIYGPAAALMTCAAVIVLLGYRLGKMEHANIRDALAVRREEKAAAGS